MTISADNFIPVSIGLPPGMARRVDGKFSERLKESVEAFPEACDFVRDAGFELAMRSLTHYRLIELPIAVDIYPGEQDFKVWEGLVEIELQLELGDEWTVLGFVLAYAEQRGER